nr:UPF0182 family protein [Pseudoclavibacter chungangensis]
MRPGNGTPRRPRPLVLTLLVVAALILLFFWFSGFYADILWFEQLGYLGVLLTQWGATASMFAIGFVAMAVPLYVNLQIVYRARPVYAKLNAQLDRYQEIIEPLRKGAMIAVPAVLGLFAGAIVATTWPTVLQWLNATPFGVADPRFGFDISFYVFHLPFWRGVVAFVSAVVLLALLLAVATSYLYGGIRITGREVVISKSARVHIAVLASVYLLVQAVSIWLDRYALVTSSSGRWTGAMYTDTHARIPGLAILAGAAAIVAVLFVVAAAIGRWRLPLMGTGLLVVLGLVVGIAYPAGIQQFQVLPSENTLEQPYIENNITATRSAYGLDSVEDVEYQATTVAEAGQLRQDAVTTANIRIMDPQLLQPTFAQLEQERPYYSFPDQLDVDRFDIDGEVQDAITTVRELNTAGLEPANQTWVNETLVYTHGYALVAASGTQRESDGQPVFLEGGVPTSGELGDFAPQIYFGENSPQYSIVGQPEGAEPAELDYISGAGPVYTTFAGSGGPNLGNFFNRLVYSIRFQSEQILLSGSINAESQILYDRDPALRVQKAAPYLTIDSDPFPTVVDGRVVWMIDAYTTTDAYPYSAQQSLSQLIADSPQSAVPRPGDTINYMRNSVKATVDAYTGAVTLYAWDTDDPILQTWNKVFPNTLKSTSEMSGDLLSHVRYPTDMFKVQRATLATYHVTNAGQFYNQQNAWQLPADPTNGSAIQPPYYLTMQMPGQDPAFSIYSTYIPRSNNAETTRNVLTGYLAANANAGSTDGVVDENYGRLTLLRTSEENINGPGQVQNIFNSNTTVANELNILERGGSTVLRGNLLTVPVGGGFLYVQPVYVKSTGETSYPLIRYVLVAFGDKIAFESTLDESLDALFGGNAGADAGDSDTGPTPDGDGAPPVEQTAQEKLSQALDDAQKALDDRTAAYANNDLVAAAEADKRLQDALARARAAESEIGTGGGTGTGADTSTSTPAPTPTP